MSKYYSINEFSEILGVSAQTLRNWDARSILQDMGYDIPLQIANSDMSPFMSTAPSLNEDKIRKFVEGARKIK